MDHGREIVVPDPSLIVLIGAAGAGKSTFAAGHFASDEVLSSDRFRSIVSGDEADQSATRAAFQRLHRAVAGRLAARRLTVIDATNVQARARRALLALADDAELPTIALVIDPPEAVVLAQNLGRPRVVDPVVVRRHLDQLRASLEGSTLANEGFADVIVLRDPAELSRIRIHRHRS